MNSEYGPDARSEQPGWGAPANRSRGGPYGDAFGGPDTGAPPGATAPPGVSPSPLSSSPSSLSRSPFADSPYDRAYDSQRSYESPVQAPGAHAGGGQGAEPNGWHASSSGYGVSAPAQAPPYDASPSGGYSIDGFAGSGIPGTADPGTEAPHSAPPLPGSPYGRPGGPPGSGGFDPPRRKRRSRQGLLLGGVAGGVLALILVGALVVTVVSNNSGGRSISNAEGKKAAAQLQQAGQQLANVPAAQYKGTVDASGNQNKVDLRATKSGLAAGTFTVGENDVAVMTVANQIYAKADKTFWVKLGVRDTSAAAVGTNWGRLDANNSRDFQFPAGGPLAQLLQKTTDEKVRNSVPANVNGVQTAKITTTDGTFYVTAAQPSRLVRMELSKGGTLFTVDLAALSEDQVGRLYTDLKKRALTLRGARDPNVFVSATPKLSFGKRTASGIIVRAKVTPAAQGGVSTIGATMSVKMTAGKRKIGGCTGTKTIKASGSTTMSCVNRTGAWRSWFSDASSTPGFHRYAAKVNVVAFAYAGVNVQQVVNGIDQERGAG